MDLNKLKYLPDLGLENFGEDKVYEYAQITLMDEDGRKEGPYSIPVIGTETFGDLQALVLAGSVEKDIAQKKILIHPNLVFEYQPLEI